MLRAFLVSVFLFAVILGLPGAARATDVHEVLFRAAPTDSPDPLNPATTNSTLNSRLKGHVAFALGPAELFLGRRYYQETTWIIKSGSTVVRTLRQETEFCPPLDLLRPREFVNADHTIAWNGKNTAGTAVASGAYTYAVQGRLIRRARIFQYIHETILATTGISSGSVTVDRTAPVATIVQPVAGANTTSTPTLTVTFTDASPSSGIKPTSFVATLDGVTVSNRFTTTATGATYAVSSSAPLSAGAHTLVVRISDNAGNTSANATRSFTTSTSDATPPVLSIVQPTAGSVGGGSPAFQLTYSDPTPGSGINTSTLTVSLDGASIASLFTKTATGATYTVPAGSPLTGGSHVLTASIKDNAGNTSVAASVTFIVDRTPPILSIVQPQPGPLATATPAFQLSFSDPSPGTGVNTGSLVATLDGTSIAAQFAVTATGATYTVPAGSPLAAGSHTLTASIKDVAGNTSTVASVTFISDATAPVLTIVQPAPDAVVTTTPMFELAYSDATPGSGINTASLTVTLDGNDVSSAFTATASGATYTVPEGSPLLGGSHTLTASIRDTAGNASATASVTFTVQGGEPDGEKPNLTIVRPQQGPTASATPTFELTFSDPAPSSGIRLNSLSVLLDDVDIASSFTTTATRATYSVPAASSLSAGLHTLSVTIRDNAGNTSWENSIRFVVGSGDAPDVAIFLPKDQSYTNEGYAFVEGTVSGQAPVTLTLNGTEAWVEDTFNFSGFFELIDEGANVLEMIVRDGSGRTTTRQFTLFRDTMPPVVSLTPAANSVLTTTTPHFTATYSDPAGGSGLEISSFTALIDNRVITSSFAISPTTAAYTLQPSEALTEGNHELEVAVGDRARNLTRQKAPFIVDTRPPTLQIQNPSAEQALATTTPRFDILFGDQLPGSGVEPSALHVTLDNLEITAGFSISTGDATYQVPEETPLSPGQHVLRAEVTDRAGHTASVERQFEVREGEFPPVRTAASGFMCGQVLDGNDQPLLGVKVTVQGVAGTLPVDAQGRYVFPSLGTGDYLLTFTKSGYTTCQRRVSVVTGRDSAVPPPHLIPLDPVVHHVVAAAGGTIHNSTGNITLEIPPGALPRDMDLTITDMPRSAVVPNFLPEESQYLSCFTVEPGFRANIPIRTSYRVQTERPFEAGFPIPIGHYSMALGRWVHEGMAHVQDDGFTISADLMHYSPMDYNAPVYVDPEIHVAPVVEETPAPVVPTSCPIRTGNSGVNSKTGAFIEHHKFPTYTGQLRTFNLEYASTCADPRSVLSINAAAGRNVDERTGRRFEVSIGTVFADLFYNLVDHPGSKKGDDAFRYLWEARGNDGQKVPSGTYPYQIRLANEYSLMRYDTADRFGFPGSGTQRGSPIALEVVPRRTAIGGRIPIVNRRTSEFGAGWSLSGMSRLYFDPDGHILAADSGESAVVFSPPEVTLADAERFTAIASEAQTVLATSTPVDGRVDFARADRLITTQDHKQAFYIDSAGGLRSYAGVGTVRLVASDASPSGARNRSMAVAPDGSKVLILDKSGDQSDDLRIQLIDVATGSRHTLNSNAVPATSNLVRGASFSADGRYAYALVFLPGVDGQATPLTVLTIDVQSEEISARTLTELNVGTGYGVHGAISPDGRTLAILRVPPNFFPSFAGGNLDEATTVTELDIASWTMQTVETQSADGSIFYTPDSRYLVMPSYDKVVAIDRRTGEEMLYSKNNNNPEIALTPDGRGAYYTLDGTTQKIDFVNHTNTPVAGLTRSAPPLAILKSATRYGPPGEFSRLVQHEDGSYSRIQTGARSGSCSCDPQTEYNARGFQTALQDEFQRRWTFTYDTQDRLSTITAPGGEGVTQFTYGAAGLTSMTDPAGRVTRFEMDASGDLARIIDPPGGGTETFEYDAEHRLIAVTDKLNSRSTVHYDNHGFVDETLAHGDRRTTLVAQDSLSLANDRPAGTGTLANRANPASRAAITSTLKSGDDIVEVRTNTPLGQPASIKTATGAARSFDYTPRGKVAVSRDALGRTQANQYDSDDTLTSTTHADGTTTTVEVTRVGSRSVPAAVISPTGARTEYTYTAQGQLSSITDANRLKTAFDYTSDGRLAVTIKPSLRSSTVSYTSVGAPETVTENSRPEDATAAATTTTYDSSRNPSTIADPGNGTTAMTFDGMGRPLTVKDADNHTTTMAYDADGNVTSFTDPRGNVTTMTWRSNHRLLSVINPLNQEVRRTHTPEGRLLTSTNFRNERLLQTFDERGRVATVTTPVGGVTTYTYNDADEVTSISDALGHVKSFAYDACGRLALVNHPDGETTARTYNTDGDLITISTPGSRTTAFIHDAAGRVIATLDPAGGATAVTYDPDGRILTSTDPLGRTTNRGYDALGRLATIKAPDGVVYTVTYNLRGDRTQIESAAGGKWTYVYTPGGRLASTKDPNNHETFYEYDGAGNITRLDQPGEAGRVVTTYTYDPLNRPLIVTTPDRSYTKTYDDAANSERTLVAPDNLDILRRRDAGGRLVEEVVVSSTGTKRVELEWDALSNLKTTKENGVTVLSYTYDSRNRPIAIRDERRNRTFALSYTPAGELAEVVYPSGIRRILAYGSRGELTSLEYKKPSGVALFRETYEYDAALQMKRIIDLSGVKASYTYDLRGQLLRAEYRNGDFEAFQYDSCGNITRYDRPSLSEVRIHNLADQLVSVASTVGGVASETTSLTYDPMGRLTRMLRPGFERSLQWNAESRLVKVQENGTQKLAAQYLDDNRLQTLETPADGAAQFSWVAANIVSEFAGNVEKFFNVSLLGVDETLDRGTPSGPSDTLIANQVRTTEHVVDELGELLGSTQYGAFGKVLGGEAQEKVGFHGARRDPGTGLTYLRNRWYDPTLARFLTRDPVGLLGGPNFYAYCLNNPITRRDPLGLASIPDLVCEQYGFCAPEWTHAGTTFEWTTASDKMTRSRFENRPFKETGRSGDKCWMRWCDVLRTETYVVQTKIYKIIMWRPGFTSGDYNDFGVYETVTLNASDVSDGSFLGSENIQDLVLSEERKTKCLKEQYISCDDCK